MVSIVNNKIKMMIMQFQIQQKRFQNTIVSSLKRSYSETTLVLKICTNKFLICYTSMEFLEIFFTASNHNSSRCVSVNLCPIKITLQTTYIYYLVALEKGI